MLHVKSIIYKNKNKVFYFFDLIIVIILFYYLILNIFLNKVLLAFYINFLYNKDLFANDLDIINRNLAK